MPWMVLAAFCLYVVWPLFTPGFIPTHDGEYHLIRFWQFHAMLSSGHLFPRWAPDLNGGYGLPLFLFHYPFPNYIGAFWHSIGFSLADSVKLTLGIGYVMMAVFCYAWLCRLFVRKAAVLGALSCMFVPYWFVDLYVRGSVGEMLAIAWVFFVLWSIESSRGLFIAVGIGLLITTHNIMALLFFPLLSLYALLKNPGHWKALGLGVGLAAYFWIPAIFERAYMTGVNTVNYADYFPQLYELLIPSWGTGFKTSETSGNMMSVQIGIIPILIGMMSTALMAKRAKSSGLGKYELFWAIAVCLSVYMMLPASNFVWQGILLLPFVQYPWRFLSVIGVATAFFAASVASRFFTLSVFFVIAGMILTASYVRPVTYPERPDSYYLSRTNFTQGTSSLGDAFRTQWQKDVVKTPSVPARIILGDAQVIRAENNGGRIVAAVSARTKSTVRLGSVYYPGWQVFVDGKKTTIDSEYGYIDVCLEPGGHDIDAQFRQTPLRKASDILSVFSCMSIVCLFFKKRTALSRT